jgi:hypothetical protein
MIGPAYQAWQKCYSSLALESRGEREAGGLPGWQMVPVPISKSKFAFLRKTSELSEIHLPYDSHLVIDDPKKRDGSCAWAT